MALVCDTSAEPEKVEPEADKDLEDGEIEDDDDEDTPVPAPATTTATAAPVATAPTPAIPTTPTSLQPASKMSPGDSHGRRRHDSDRTRGKPYLTEAERSVRHLHKLERAERERERREKMRKEQLGVAADDWTGNIEKAIATVLKKDKHMSPTNVGAVPPGDDIEENDEQKRGRKRRKKDKDRKRKHRRQESPKQDEAVDEDDMIQVRGGSPDKMAANQPHGELHEDSYDSQDSSYDSEPYNQGPRQGKKFDRLRNRPRMRNQERNRDRKNNFKDKRGNDRRMAGDQQQQQQLQQQNNRPQLQDSGNVCVFYMQGKCHKGDDCPYSHDALPPMKLELCKFYLMNCCAKQDKCLYMHSEFPCKYYHTGLKCPSTDNCKFAHGRPLSDTLKQILLKHLETAPKEILGDFPRLSRDGAQHMINATQKSLEMQYDCKQQVTRGGPGIPSLFDITIPVPPELIQGSNEQKPKTEKAGGRVRQTRWNDEPPVPPAMLSSIFESLTQQDQQKLNDYHASVNSGGKFYGGQDQDMRVVGNGDVDMRSLPAAVPQPAEIDFEKYRRESGIADKDHRTLETNPNDDLRTEESNLQIVEEEDSRGDRAHDIEASDSSNNVDSGLTIAENEADLPSHLPKKQRELFMRIKAQQKENVVESGQQASGNSSDQDDYSYSSDEDMVPLSKMLKNLKEEPKHEMSPRRLSPPTIRPVEVIDKLGDLSKIDISAEVTKLLSSIKTGQAQIQSQATNVSETKVSRDPRQSSAVSNPTPTVSSYDPRLHRDAEPPKREPKISIYEQGAITADGSDVDLRSLSSSGRDTDLRMGFGDTDLRQLGRPDVDLRQLGLPFKAMQNYTPATEIDASIGSHSPMIYKVHLINIPRPDYSSLKLKAQDVQSTTDPRLRKIFRLSVDEKDSPASPKQEISSPPPKVARQDPRRRPKAEEPAKPDTTNLTYAQQLSMLQNSAFYQSLTSKQKLMLNQEVAVKAEATGSDPLLAGVLSNLGLTPPVQQAPSNSAASLLANVSSMVPGMGVGPFMQAPVNPAMGSMPPMIPQAGQGLLGAAPGIPNMPMGPNMGPNMGANMGPNMGANMGPNMGANMGPNMGANMGPMGEFPMNFPRNTGGLLGNAPPFQPFNDGNMAAAGGQNFNNFNEEFYQNEGGFNRGDRRNQQQNRRGRSWNNRHNNNNNNRNYNRNRNRSNRSYTPP